jgi:acyl-CoA synthetase (AMP-forming)/AMP-acid ligase II
MLYDNLSAIVARAPTGNGLRHDGRTQTYAVLLERITRLAAGLRDRGIGHGDPVVILMSNGPELFVAIYALWSIGAVALPLAPSATLAECEFAARKAKAKAVLAQSTQLPLAESLAAKAGLAVFAAGGDGANVMATLERSAVGALPTLPGTTTAIYLMSSGSTGLPKIVPHTHAELLADGRRTSTAWKLTADDIVFDMLPPNFAMGVLLGLTNAAEAGATTVYWNDPRPLTLMRGKLLDTLVAERVSFMGAVPTMYETLLGAKGVERLPLRLAFCGGAALSRELFERFRDRFGVSLRQSYGSTEAIFVAHNDADDADATWNSVGRPAGDARATVALVPELGEGIGELLLQSSSMTEGYLDDPSANAASFEDGWLKTGDLGRMAPDGSISITGRSKLLIEVGGYKIDPLEVEDVLRRHPAVDEAVVLAVRDGSYGGPRLKAVIVPSDDVSADELTRHLRERLSAQKVPALFEFRTDLPKSSAGKILRSQIG